jgi:hypothetical protein
MKWPRWQCWSINRSGRGTSNGWPGSCTRLWETRRARSTTSDPHRCRAWRPRTVWTFRCASSPFKKPGRPGSSPRSACVAGPSRGTEPRCRADAGVPQVGVRPAGGCAEVQRTPAPGRGPELPLRAPVPRLPTCRRGSPTAVGSVQTTAGPERAGLAGQRADQGTGHRDPYDRGRTLGSGDGLAAATGVPRAAHVSRGVSRCRGAAM